jgi:simple sugar transport system ATP-binding protein
MNVKGTLMKAVNISKSFGKIQALKNVDFQISYGEIVGLVGDNGAGKSTLVKILSGVYQPDEGEIFFEGKKVSLSSPAIARNLGIETVYQDGALIPLMSIWRNFFLGKEILNRKFFVKTLDKKRMKEECASYLGSIGIRPLSLDKEVAILSGGERQAVSIGRAMYFKAKLIFLDEPTAALSIREAERVLQFISEVRKAGISIVFITHNIYHVYTVADRFVILERGKKIGEFNKEEVTPEYIMDIIRSGRVK